MPALRQRQVEHKFCASLGYIARTYQRIKEGRNGERERKGGIKKEGKKEITLQAT
jgi:hypothetical protein